MNNLLDKRLLCASDFVPVGAVLADIGSDHALLPISLALEGRIARALASDINDGPVLAARKNIAAHGVETTVAAQKSDGLDGVEDFSPDCITILGMGGELIARIIDRAEWVREPKITLILQPMTHGEILSKYLCENGFEITDGRILCENERSDRIYRIMVARFDGKVRTLTEAEHFVGRENLSNITPDTEEYIRRILRMLDTRISGRTAGGLDCTQEREIAQQLKKYI